jgi:hypothetical protein
MSPDLALSPGQASKALMRNQAFVAERAFPSGHRVFRPAARFGRIQAGGFFSPDDHRMRACRATRP